MVDTRTFLSEEGPTTVAKYDYKFLETELTLHSSYSDMVGQTLSDFIFGSFHHIDMATTPSLPTERHYFQMPPMIPGFALNDKTWKIFSIETLIELQPTISMDSLIIDPVTRDIVLAVTHAQDRPFKIDHAHNKGEGYVTSTMSHPLFTRGIADFKLSTGR